jgi:hypothetical protein
MSKSLESILKKMPPATAQSEEESATVAPRSSQEQEKRAGAQSRERETDRIVAIIPRILKQEIKAFTQKNPGQTERSVILAALKTIGFNVKDEWIVDKRSLRQSKTP